jgi:hypothetical protein
MVTAAASVVLGQLTRDESCSTTARSSDRVRCRWHRRVAVSRPPSEMLFRFCARNLGSAKTAAHCQRPSCGPRPCQHQQNTCKPSWTPQSMTSMSAGVHTTGRRPRWFPAPPCLVTSS